MYVVTVSFVVKPVHLQDFMQALLANARTSLSVEPGCRQFDVCVDPRNRCCVFLYEVYDDAAAFQAHLAAPHYAAFAHSSAGWVESKTVQLLERIDSA